MMYHEKLAVAIKNNGKVLREFKDTVYVPFGTEYSLFIKNLNSTCVRVNVEIDGKDIADGNYFIIGPGDSLDLERFLKNGNIDKGNRFRFIEHTANVEAHRGGIQLEDGLVRISYEFDQQSAPITKQFEWHSTPAYYSSSGSGVSGAVAHGSLRSNSSFSGGSFSVNAFDGAIGAINSINVSASASSYDPDCTTKDFYFGQTAPQNEAGVTAAGSISEQQFKTCADIKGDGVKHVMVLKLLGEIGQTKVKEAVTVKHKPVCDGCGKINKAAAKFCIECGSSLDIV